MGAIFGNIIEAIGYTPLVKINKLGRGNADIVVKLESFNPGGSVNDRIALSMIEAAEEKVLIKEGAVIIEPTSGNTGIGLACICAIKGYRLILTMPDTMSHERRKLLSAYGAELVITPGERGMRGAIEKAEELMDEHNNTFMLQQFNNTSNPEAHERTTAVEIWEDSSAEVDCVIAGVGTGGTITGVARFLKKKKKSIQFIAVEPKASPVLSGGEAGPHSIQGIGPGFIPRVLDMSCIDETITVSDSDAAKTCRLLSRKEGILAGISSGAAAWAAIKVSKREEYKGKLIVVIFPDGGEKYLSMGLFE